MGWGFISKGSEELARTHAMRSCHVGMSSRVNTRVLPVSRSKADTATRAGFAWNVSQSNGRLPSSTQPSYR